MPAVELFHYHLVTNRAREVEARYLGKLGFELVARHGRLGEEVVSYRPGVSWVELDGLGFELGLSELELGAVNVVIQPGLWPLPRVDHLGLALGEHELEQALGRARSAGLAIQEHDDRPALVSTSAGYRLELSLLVDAIDTSAIRSHRLLELYLKTDDPDGSAAMLAGVLDCVRAGGKVEVGETLVRFVPGGPHGRPELYAERFG